MPAILQTRANAIALRLAAVVAALTILAMPARADEEAEAAVRAWIGAVASGDANQIGAELAPEFQIQRADGSGYDKADYVAGGFAAITDVLDVEDVIATRNEDIMVVRYILTVTETINGQPVEARSPRLTVFRWDGERWLVVAHANFARIEG